MPAVSPYRLAEIYDIALTGPPAAALAMLSDDVKNAQLAKASGEVLAAYGIRYELPLKRWGSFTKGLVIDIAVWALLGTSRGINPETPDGKILAAADARARKLLDEISDITNRTPRRDPDVIDALGSRPGYEDLGALAHSEGGRFDEADHYAHPPRTTDLVFGERNNLL